MEHERDRYWKWYSEALETSRELREQLHRAIRERDEERILRKKAEAKVVDLLMDRAERDDRIEEQNG